MSNDATYNPKDFFESDELSEQDEALKMLDDAFRVPNNTVPENVFREAFIPFFAQEAENIKYPVTMANWISIAKHQANPVDVVDAQGKILFTVPPMIDRRAINPNTDGTPMQHIIKTFQSYNNIHPSQGRAYLEQQMARRKLLNEAGPLVVEQLRVWDKIFVRYGRQPVLRAEDTAPEVKKTTTASPDDFYDAPM